MTRLIDADKLLAEYDRIHVGEPGRARKLIEEQPTVNTDLSDYSDRLWQAAYERGKAEARKTGKWIWMVEKGDSRFMCSVCRSKEDVPTCNGKPTIWWYCPSCGAKMRKETEGE